MLYGIAFCVLAQIQVSEAWSMLRGTWVLQNTQAHESCFEIIHPELTKLAKYKKTIRTSAKIVYIVHELRMDRGINMNFRLTKCGGGYNTFKVYYYILNGIIFIETMRQMPYITLNYTGRYIPWGCIWFCHRVFFDGTGRSTHGEYAPYISVTNEERL